MVMNIFYRMFCYMVIKLGFGFFRFNCIIVIKLKSSKQIVGSCGIGLYFFVKVKFKVKCVVIIVKIQWNVNIEVVMIYVVVDVIIVLLQWMLIICFIYIDGFFDERFLFVFVEGGYSKDSCVFGVVQVVNDVCESIELKYYVVKNG